MGRERELAIAASSASARSTAGRGQVVFVAGEAGIGKSRLLLEFRRALAEAGEAATWLEGQCVSFGQSIPFLPLVDQLRKNFGIEEFDGEPEIIAKVEHGMRRMGELDGAHPVHPLPAVRGSGRSAPSPPWTRRARRRKCFEAVRALSLRGARLRPLVLVFEDLHWIDGGSEEYLGLAHRLGGRACPLMLILTYRVGYAPPFRTRSFHTTLTLARPVQSEDALTMAARRARQRRAARASCGRRSWTRRRACRSSSRR